MSTITNSVKWTRVRELGVWRRMLKIDRVRKLIVVEDELELG